MLRTIVLLACLVGALYAQNACNNKCACDGDPHCTNFDCVPFDLKGLCTYTFASTHCIGKNFPEDLTQFKVLQKSSSCQACDARFNRTIVTGLILEIFSSDYVLDYDENTGVSLLVNGIQQQIPYSEDYNNLTVSQVDGGLSLKIQLNNDEVLTVELFKLDNAFSPRASVQLPNSYSNHVCGLCGNFNGNQDDDFVDRNSNPVAISSAEQDVQEDLEWYSWTSQWRDGVDFGNDIDGASCRPQLSCGCSGDPHCYDFANNKFDSQNPSMTSLVGIDISRPVPTYLTKFNVYQVQVPGSEPETAVVQAVMLNAKLNSYKLAYDPSSDSVLLTTRNQPQSIPFADSNAGVTVSQIQDGLLIQTNFGIELSLVKGASDFSPRSSVRISSAYEKNIVGSCVPNA